MNSEVSLNHPEELTEKMSLDLDLDQQVQLTEEEDQANLLMIGGIQIFLPHSLEEVEIYITNATAGAGQPAETVRGALEQTLEVAQEEEEDDEHSKKWINIFSQETKKTAVFELVEEADNIILADLYEQIEDLDKRVIVRGMHIQ